MFRAEWKKLFRQRWLVCLALLLVTADLALFAGTQYTKHGDRLAATALFQNYREESAEMTKEQALQYLSAKQMELSDFQFVQLVLGGEADEELLTVLLEANPQLLEQYRQAGYEDDPQALRAAAAVLSSLTGQYQRALEYPAYLQAVRERYEQMLDSSFYEGRPYAQALGQKTAEDFARLTGTELETGMEWGVDALMEEQVSSVILVLLALALCVVSVSQDRSNELFGLLRSCRRGHTSLLAVKFAVVLTAAAGLCLIVYAGETAIAWRLYGMDSLNRPMQSVSILYGSARQLTLGGYLLDYYLRNTAAVLVLAAAAECLLLLLHSAFTALAAVGAGAAVCFAGYFSVAETAGHAWIHFMNPVAWFSGPKLYGSYWNIRLCGKPVNALLANTYLQLLLTAVSLTVGILLLGRRMPGRRRLTAGPIRKLLQKIREKLWYPSGVTAQEWKKQLFHNHLIWMLAAASGLLFFSMRTTPLEFGQIESVYQEYAKKYEGPADDALLAALLQEKTVFDQLRLRQEQLEQKRTEGQISEEQYTALHELIGNLLKNEAGLDRAIGQARTLNAWGKAYGRQLYFTDDSVGRYLFANESADLYRGAFLILLLIILTGGIFPGERRNEMLNLLLCTKKGRMPLFTAKYLLGGVIAALITAAGMAANLYSASRMYGFSLWGIPLQSFSQAQEFTVPMSVGGYLLMTALLQMAGMACLSVCFLSVSVWMKNRLYAVLTGSTLFVLPALAAGAEISAVFRPMSGRIFLSGTQALYQGMAPQLWYLLLLAAVSACLCAAAWRKYQRKEHKRPDRARRAVG